ncbi:MAG TPA: purine-nucleoside phosphorylase [Terriglobales bacterium]|jgi:purine-nucleoside phosphorylase|nr:purine-nucleoside phosphorylase [Terriglobales bacterium]
MRPTTRHQQRLDEFARARRAANLIRARIKAKPEIGLVLGSGLGGFADSLAGRTVIPYQKIAGFPRCSAIGHAGRLVFGKIASVPVVIMQGRVHLYEGHSPQDVIFPTRVLGQLGVRAVILTNAAGGINPDLPAGCFAVLSDHINLQGTNPLVGPNDERFGLRFFDMTETYDRRFQGIAVEEATRLGVRVGRGIYAALIGPSYETPAEIRYLRAIGADLVGMSTVPEVIAARHMGIRVLAISCVTNIAAGLSPQKLDYKEVLEIGERLQGQLGDLLQAIVPRMQKELGERPDEAAQRL